MRGGEPLYPDLRFKWRFTPGQMVAVSYPYEPATVRAGDAVAASDIGQVFLSTAPPCMRVGNELLFVSATQRDELEAFATDHALPVDRGMLDPWGLILEPFLDTEHDEEWAERALVQLEELGIGRDETAALRSRFGGMLMLYNFAIPRWEYVHLGHADLLAAAHPTWRYGDDLITRRIRQRYKVREPLNTAESYREVYWSSMEIALRQFGS